MVTVDLFSGRDDCFNLASPFAGVVTKGYTLRAVEEKVLETPADTPKCVLPTPLLIGIESHRSTRLGMEHKPPSCLHFHPYFPAES
jgi:hypothetical protein